MQHPFCLFSLPVATFLLVLSLFAGASAKNDQEKTDDSILVGTIVVVRPPSLFGGAQALLSADGKAQKYATGPLSFSADVKAGEYDIYSVNASRPLTTLRVVGGKTLYVVRNSDDAGHMLFTAMRGQASGQGELKKILRSQPSGEPVPDTSEWAEAIIVSPQTAFGDKAALMTGDRRKNENVSKRILSARILPGSYAVFDNESEKPLASVTVASGGLLYAVAAAHAGAQRQLGDIFFDNGNRKGAFSLYRSALAIDSAMTDLYKRYAGLALDLEGGREAIPALLRLDRSKQADGQDYQTLGDLLATANRNVEAQQMYAKALSMANSTPSVFAGLGAVKSRTGDLRGAAAAYENAIRLLPDSTGLYRLAGDVYLRQKDTVKALASYDKYLEKGGKNTATAYCDGRLRFLRGEYGEARARLLLVSGKNKEKAEYLWMLGESNYRLKEYASAATLLARAASVAPPSPRRTAVMEMLLNSLAKTGNDAKARIWLEKYSQSPRRNAATVAYFGALFKEKSLKKAAMALYEQNMKKYPGDYRSYLRSGTLLSADGAALGRALELLKKAAELADTVPEAWKALAAVYGKLGKTDDELAALQVYCSADPLDAKANARIGELMLRKGKTGEAIEKLEAAGNAGPADPAVLKALAQGYAATGKPDSAIAVLRRARKSAPGDLSIRERLIELLRRTGPADSLLGEYRMMLELKRDTVTLTTYAGLLFDNGKFPEAQNVLEDLRAVRPDYVPGLMLLCRVLRAQQKYQPAVDVYKEIIEIDPLRQDALFERAETHLENGQPYWAELFYRRTLKENPRHARAELGLARVEKLRRNYTAYMFHINRARKLAPEDPAIEQEYAEGKKGAW
jgi:tetratricopeptide (TPR) repeat protein